MYGIRRSSIITFSENFRVDRYLVTTLYNDML